MKGKTAGPTPDADFSGPDEVMKEVWRIRDAISASYGHDVGRLCAAMREMQKRSGHQVVDLSRSYRGEPAAPACVRETPPEKDKK